MSSSAFVQNFCAQAGVQTLAELVGLPITLHITDANTTSVVYTKIKYVSTSRNHKLKAELVVAGLSGANFVNFIQNDTGSTEVHFLWGMMHASPALTKVAINERVIITS